MPSLTNQTLPKSCSMVRKSRFVFFDGSGEALVLGVDIGVGLVLGLGFVVFSVTFSNSDFVSSALMGGGVSWGLNLGSVAWLSAFRSCLSCWIS